MSQQNAAQSANDEPVEEAAGVGDARAEATRRFIVFWGEMASSWGINRTMAQIHALLYCAEEPLDTDAIMERLQISRGNANMNLRSLIDWSLAYKTQRAGSRKDFYEAEKDVWRITAQIIKERERREINPVREQLRACRDLLGGAAAPGEACEALPEADRVLCRRFENLMDLVEVFEGFSTALMPLVQERNAGTLKKLVQAAHTLQAEQEEEEE